MLNVCWKNVQKIAHRVESKHYFLFNPLAVCKTIFSSLYLFKYFIWQTFLHLIQYHKNESGKQHVCTPSYLNTRTWESGSNILHLRYPIFFEERFKLKTSINNVPWVCISIVFRLWKMHVKILQWKTIQRIVFPGLYSLISD